tara:strand:- start:4405 stop:5805 length:1401 start_codon:yes stop_codon:yes gene_type:complete
MRKDDFLNSNHFTWFTGVVEDRFDPEEMGRVKVRCFGYHTEDKEFLPTDDLPWATVLLPTTASGTSGVGDTPHGLMEGSWVVGFFRDGPSAQDPIVMGSVAAKSSTRKKTLGFTGNNYPKGEYIDKPDVNFSARTSTYEGGQSAEGRGGKELPTVSTASPAKLPTVAIDKDASFYEKVTWNELKPFYGHDGTQHIPEYPYNKVMESEGGHIMEIDDTPGMLRLNKQHESGTYEEIYNDGSRQVKIVGKDYEITLAGKNMYVRGDLNMTVEGNMRQLVKGNYHLEVDKDMTMNIKGSYQQRMKQHEAEIERNRSINVGKNDSLKVGEDLVFNVNGNRLDTIVGSSVMTSQGDSSISVQDGDLILFAKKDFAVASVEDTTLSAANIKFETTGNKTELIDGAHSITVVGQQTFQADNLDIKNNVDLTGTLDASVEVKAGDPEVTLTAHVHPQGNDGGGDTQVNTGSGTG